MASKKTCPRCRATFTCTGDSDCWCENVQLHKRELTLIMEQYTDCLCPECLKTYERD